MNDNRPAPVDVLLVEDDLDYAELIKAMFAEERVAALPPMVIRLHHAATLREAQDYLGGDRPCDMILFDLTLPDSQGLDTISRMSPYAAERPAIVLTSRCDDVLPIEALKRGSQDYLVKGEINPILLFRSMRYAIERFRICKEREKLITDLQNAVGEINILSDLIPVCMYCKRARIDKVYWARLENYINLHSNAQVSHGICPECAKTIHGLDVSRLKS